MADFFSRLAERALGVANIARPSKLSVYAPAPSDPFATGQEEEPAASLSLGEEAADSPKGALRLQSQSPREIHEAEAPSRPSLWETKSDPGPAKEFPRGTGKEATRRTRSELIEGVLKDQTGHLGLVSPMIGANATIPTERAEGDSRTDPSVSTKDSRTAGGRRRVDSSDVPMTRSWLGSEVERREKHQRPVVRVTIGRVEVRAVMTPPPPRPSGAPAPKVTPLEEYLKQREEARR